MTKLEVPGQSEAIGERFRLFPFEIRRVPSTNSAGSCPSLVLNQKVTLNRITVPCACASPLKKVVDWSKYIFCLIFLSGVSGFDL